MVQVRHGIFLIYKYNKNSWRNEHGYTVHRTIQARCSEILDSDKFMNLSLRKIIDWVFKRYFGGYSKKSYPWDKTCIESFHAQIKREWINDFKILD